MKTKITANTMKAIERRIAEGYESFIMGDWYYQVNYTIRRRKANTFDDYEVVAKWNVNSETWERI